MTNETQRLFSAPWIRCRIEIEGKMQPCVSARTNHTVAISFDEKDANRLANLPELYDALIEAARYRCWHCRHEDFPDFACIEDFEKNCKTVSCGCRDWWKLLRKVRDGNA